MSQDHSSSQHGSRRSSNSTEHNRVALVDRTRRTRRNVPTVQNDEQRSMKEYIPSGAELFAKLFTIEQSLTNVDGTMSTFVQTYAFTCRVYYTFLFHVRLIQARIDAGEAHPAEAEAIRYIDEQVHINTLPIHDELVETFRLTFPAVQVNRHTNGICPTEPRYTTFEFTSYKNKPPRIVTTLISEQHSLQPSLRVSFHYLRWLFWNKDSTNNENLPSISDRLNFLVFGHPTTNLRCDPTNELKFRETMQVLFANPVFKETFLNVPGVTYQSLADLDELCIPPEIKPMDKSTPIHEVICNELLYNSDLQWLNHCKYIVSTLCHLTGNVSHFSEVNEPYNEEELRNAMRHVSFVEQNIRPVHYPDARTWMSIYNDDSEYAIAQIDPNT